MYRSIKKLHSRLNATFYLLVIDYCCFLFLKILTTTTTANAATKITLESIENSSA